MLVRPLKRDLVRALAGPLVPSSGAPIVPTTGNLVASRTQYHTGITPITQPFTSRREHYAHGSGDISALQTIDINRYISSINTTSTGAIHTIKRYIEYPAGVFYQVLWAGASTVSLSAGGRVVSDIVAGLTIPAGAKFWERTVILTTATIPIIILPAGSDVLGVDDGNVSGDLGNSGTVPPTTGLNTLGCQAIIGTVNATAARSFVVIGDSLVFGALDDTGVGTRHGSGWVARMLDNLGLPYFKWCLGGQQATDQAALIATINADVGVMGFTDLIVQSGLNDLRLGRTKAQIETDYQTIFAAANITGKRKYLTTITPRSTSTDAWATTINQTAQTDGNMADLTGLNTDIRAGQANAFGFIEAADAAMSARDSKIHKAPPAGTADGTHFNSVRAALVASLVTV
jgi:hypothetical protein